MILKFFLKHRRMLTKTVTFSHLMSVSGCLVLALALRHRLLRPSTMKRNLRFRQKLGQVSLFMGLAFTTIAMNGCDAVYLNEAESLSQVRAKKEIVVLTTQSPLIYSQARRGEPFGIDHDLLQSFASSYGIKLRFVVLPDEESVLRALAKNEGDIAAARLRSPEENSGFLTGPAYEDSALELFCHRNLKIQNIKDLSFKRLALLKKDDFKGLSQRLPLLTPITSSENPYSHNIFSFALNVPNF
jgi:membrane-bound lytic murein transglycosylase F